MGGVREGDEVGLADGGSAVDWSERPPLDVSGHIAFYKQITPMSTI